MEMFQILITVVIIQLCTFFKTFTTRKLYFNKPVYKKIRNHLSLMSFPDDKCIIHTKGELELISGNIRKADFNTHKQKKIKNVKKENELVINPTKYGNQWLNDPANDAVEMILLSVISDYGNIIKTDQHH